MTLIPHKTDYAVSFWIPLPNPVGVPDGTELSLSAAGAFPENKPGFLVPDHDDGPQYLAQSWMFFQKTETPTSRPFQFAEELFRHRLSKDMGIDDPGTDVSAKMRALGTQWHTVVEVLCPLEEPEENRIVAKLNEAVMALANFQIGLSQLNGMPSHILTPRSIDPVPFLVTSFVEPSEVLYGLTSIGNVTKYVTLVDIPMATEAELELAATGSLGKTAPFRSAKVLEMEAQSARASGAHILAAICLGAAAEARLTELCQILSWEAENDPSLAAKASGGNGGISNGCLQLLASHLRGNWDRHQSPAIHQWDQYIVKLRNKTAHGGYEPTVSDIDRALDAYHELGVFIRTSLLRNLERFPYVNSYYLGQETLRLSKKMQTWEQIMNDYKITSDPEASFSRYKAEMRASDISPRTIVEGDIILRLTIDGSESWIEVNERYQLCREVSVPISTEWNELQRIRGRRGASEFTEILTDIITSATAPSGDWKRASAVIPTCSTRRSDIYEFLDFKIKAS